MTRLTQPKGLHLVLALVVALTGMFAAGFERDDEATAASPQDLAATMKAEMKIINRTLRGLRGKIDKPEERAAALADITKLQLATVKSKGMTPKLAATIAEDKREKFVSDFRLMQLDMLAKTIEMEKLVLAGDGAGVKTLLTAIAKMKSPAHRKFKGKKR